MIITNLLKVYHNIAAANMESNLKMIFFLQSKKNIDRKKELSFKKEKLEYVDFLKLTA